MSEVNQVKAELERLIDSLETEYGSTCSGGQLEHCQSFIELKEIVEDTPDTISTTTLTEKG